MITLYSVYDYQFFPMKQFLTQLYPYRYPISSSNHNDHLVVFILKTKNRVGFSAEDFNRE